MRDSGLLDFKVLLKSIKTTEVIYFIKVISITSGNLNKNILPENMTLKRGDLVTPLKLTSEREDFIKEIMNNLLLTIYNNKGDARLEKQNNEINMTIDTINNLIEPGIFYKVEAYELQSMYSEELNYVNSNYKSRDIYNINVLRLEEVDIEDYPIEKENICRWMKYKLMESTRDIEVMNRLVTLLGSSDMISKGRDARLFETLIGNHEVNILQLGNPSEEELNERRVDSLITSLIILTNDEEDRTLRAIFRASYVLTNALDCTLLEDISFCREQRGKYAESIDSYFKFSRDLGDNKYPRLDMVFRNYSLNRTKALRDLHSSFSILRNRIINCIEGIQEYNLAKAFKNEREMSKVIDACEYAMLEIENDLNSDDY